MIWEIGGEIRRLPASIETPAVTRFIAQPIPALHSVLFSRF